MNDYRYLEKVIASSILSETTNTNNEVITYVTKALKLLNYSEDDIRKIIVGVYLMDIGLHINVNSTLDYEYHTINGCAIISVADELEMIKNIVLLHHENNVGSGFPYGLIGSQIPEYVQIVSICNEYIDLKTSLYLSQNDIHDELISKHRNDKVEFLYKYIFN